MSIDFYIKGKPQKRKAKPKQKRRKFPAQKQPGQGTMVTDHCLVQFMNRVDGMSTEAVRAYIQEITQAAIDAGACSVVVDGVKYIFENGCVVTCYKVGAEA